MAYSSIPSPLGSPSLSECVSYALLKLQMSDVSLKAEQRSSMKAIYDGRDVFVWLPTGYGKSLLSSLTISDGFQKRSRGRRKPMRCVGNKSIGCFNDRSSEKPEEKGS